MRTLVHFVGTSCTLYKHIINDAIRDATFSVASVQIVDQADSCCWLSTRRLDRIERWPSPLSTGFQWRLADCGSPQEPSPEKRPLVCRASCSSPWNPQSLFVHIVWAASPMHQQWVSWDDCETEHLVQRQQADLDGEETFPGAVTWVGWTSG